MLSNIIHNRAIINTTIKSFSTNTNAYHVALNEKYVCHNYAPFPIAIEKAERIYITDVEGRTYMDWMSGFGSTS